MRRQRLWSIFVCTKLSIPLFLAGAFFVAMYFSGKVGTDDIATDAKIAFTIEQRKVGGGARMSTGVLDRLEGRARKRHIETHTQRQ
jgi:hypothetical protein